MARKVERRKLTKSAVGDMRERISLERRETVAPDFDQPENTIAFTVIQVVWARVDSIMYQGSGEQIYNGVNVSKVPAMRFTIRFRDDISSYDTVVRWRGGLYKIDATGSPEERREYTQITCVLRGKETLGANQ